MPWHISRKKGTMSEDNKKYFLFLSVELVDQTPRDSEPSSETLLLLLKTTVF